MRGFRGSRAAQNNVSARHGQTQIYGQFRSGIPYYPNQQERMAQRPPLPDWLKTPETRAKEQLQTYGQAGKRSNISPAQAHVAAQAKAPLRAVTAQPAAARSAVAMPVAGRQKPQLQMIKGGAAPAAKTAIAAKPKKTVAPKKKAAKAKPKSKPTKVARKATAAKRKAA